jgi:hypothetical protein
MANQMWMGIPGSHAQWVPCPLIDSTISRKRYVERMQFHNGGGDVARSNQYQMEYNLAFSGPAHDFDGIDALNRFASGYYGDGYVYLTYPTSFKTNMFSAQWATPALRGWTNSVYQNGTVVATVSAASGSNLYPNSMEFTLVGSANAVPDERFTILVPPGHTLILGATGTKTGTAVVAQRVTTSTGTMTTTSLTLIAPSATTGRFNSTVAATTTGVTVELYLTRTTTASSTITLAALSARLYETSAYVATLLDDNVQVYGEGSTGLQFADEAIVENYSYMYPPRKGISTTLVEVEAWR